MGFCHRLLPYFSLQDQRLRVKYRHYTSNLYVANFRLSKGSNLQRIRGRLNSTSISAPPNAADVSPGIVRGKTFPIKGLAISTMSFFTRERSPRIHGYFHLFQIRSYHSSEVIKVIVSADSQKSRNDLGGFVHLGRRCAPRNIDYLQFPCCLLLLRLSGRKICNFI